MDEKTQERTGEYYKSKQAVFELVYGKVPYVTLNAFVRMLAVSMGMNPEGAMNMAYELYVRLEKELAADQAGGAR